MDTSIKLEREPIFVNPEFIENCTPEAGVTIASADATLHAVVEPGTATFKLARSSFRNTVALSQLFGRSPDEEIKDNACLKILPGQFQCMMQRRTVSTRATVGLMDETARIPAEGVAFEAPVVQVARLATRTAGTKQKIVAKGKDWTWTVWETPGRFEADLTVCAPSEEMLKPWQVAERTLVSRIDPDALRVGLTYAAAISHKTGSGPHTVVEVCDGVARGTSMTSVALVSGKALEGINVRISAKDVDHACRVLREMDARKTHLWSATGYQYIVSGNLELAIRTPVDMPANTARFVAMALNDPVTMCYSPLLLSSMMARPLSGRTINLDLQLRGFDESKLALTAQNARGRFAYVAPHVASSPDDDNVSKTDVVEMGEPPKPDFDAMLSRDDEPLAVVPYNDFLKMLLATPDPDAITLDIKKRSVLMESSARGLIFRAYVPTVASLG
ncbi:MAG TPA: hypothetical protein VGN91_15610 [Bosea sp. (in: a-proteobacteria)]|jgi:hypothetical protein|nr:hypothetical protein [Bosea sp. (in: a-proteobacteria)]